MVKCYWCRRVIKKGEYAQNVDGEPFHKYPCLLVYQSKVAESKKASLVAPGFTRGAEPGEPTPVGATSLRSEYSIRFMNSSEVKTATARILKVLKDYLKTEVILGSKSSSAAFSLAEQGYVSVEEDKALDEAVARVMGSVRKSFKPVKVRGRSNSLCRLIPHPRPRAAENKKVV